MKAASLGGGEYKCHAPKRSNLCMHVSERQTGREGEKKEGREGIKRGHNGLKTAIVSKRNTSLTLPELRERER